jgi:phosphonate transport system permease protein
VAFLLLFLAVLFSLPVIAPTGRTLDYAGNLTRFLSRFWPPDFSILPQILPSLWETFQMAVLATTAAALLSIPVAAAASKTTAPAPVVALMRFLLNAIRAIPGLVWALLTVAVLGANPGAGVLALSIYSIGYLGKFFSDAFESADPGVSEALRATGADRLQAFQYGIWPHARPIVWSHVLWMLEYNIRSDHRLCRRRRHWLLAAHLPGILPMEQIRRRPHLHPGSRDHPRFRRLTHPAGTGTHRPVTQEI